MYGEERPTLHKILELVEENSKILHRLQRARRWATFLSVAKWLGIIAIAAGSYYYLQPFLGHWPETWQKFQELMDNLNILNQP